MSNYTIVSQDGGADASGDRTSVYGPFETLEKAQAFGDINLNHYSIYPITAPKNGEPCDPRCNVITHFPLKRVTVHHMFNLAQAAQALKSEYSPHDCHCDISPSVSHIMGFYEGAAERNPSDGSALDLVIEDLIACTSHYEDVHLEQP
jgi:hypothetical protein